MCKVSVLLPVFNAEKYLAEAIDSIISQTWEEWELIIINDGSTDSSLSIIESYSDKRIRLINNEFNLGLIKTLNKGIELCRGEYIARMDADDIAHPERLEKQINFLDQNSNYILCGTNADIINDNGEKIGKIINPARNIHLQISLLFTNPFVHPSMMIRKSVFEDCLYNEKALHVEDFELWIRLSAKGKIANLEQALLKYRWHDTNVSQKHMEIQEKAKNKIIKHQLLKLGIKATEEELYVHRLTFQLYNFGIKKRNGHLDTSVELSNWFLKLKQNNKLKKIYPQTTFDSFLWSRWIVMCVHQKKYLTAIYPKFITLSPSIIYQTFLLILYLRKK